MTRKKSRPQHRENVSPKSANEGGYYKMFWDSMVDDEGTNACPQSPEVVPRNSPSLIVINDSDDENPYTINETSGDILGIPLPIKQELLLGTQTKNSSVGDKDQNEVLDEVIPRNLTSVFVIDDSDDENTYKIDGSSGDSLQTPLPIKQEVLLETSASGNDRNEDQSGVISSEETIEDAIVPPLQPTSLGQNSSALCGVSINSLPLVSNQRTLFETPRSPNQANSSEESCSVSQDNVIVNDSNNLILENTVNISEHSTLSCEASIPSEPQAFQENGHPDVGKVSSISSPPHQIEDISGSECTIPLGNEPVVDENRCEEEEMPVDEQFEDNTGSTQAMSDSTGQALELLKSLLVSPQEEDLNRLTSTNNDGVSMNVDINLNEALIPKSDNPLHVQRENARPQLTLNNSDGNPKDPVDKPACSPSDHALGVPVTAVTSHVDSSITEPTIIHQGEPVIISELEGTAADEFPAYDFLPSITIIEPIAIKSSLDLLRKELLALYNNCNVKIAFEHKTDDEVVDEAQNKSRNGDIEVNNPITPQCCVMVERLSPPMVLKGYVALSSKLFKKWKLRTIRMRNEEKFRHLGVWRRGRTRLWRECQLAGMDKSSYETQVEYIEKHRICETSSSDESSGEESHSSIDNLFEKVFGIHPKAAVAADDSSTNESDVSELDSDSTLPSSPEKPRSGNSSNFDVPGSTIKISDVTDRKLVQYKSLVCDVSPCRDEYIVERNTLHEDLNSEGKESVPLKITIRKTSFNKSEDEREKSVERDVGNGFTVPPKPVGKGVKRTFVTKRTYRKPEEPHISPPSALDENDTEKSSDTQKFLFEPTKKRTMPHYVEDNNDNEESLLGRRSYEVENFNLLEKWDIPFEEPTLFRSPRVASRLAQIKTKEAFTRKNYVRHQPVPPKPVTLCKEVKEVVEMLCSKTVEAMLLPDAIINSLKVADCDNQLEPVTLAPEVHSSIEAEETPLHNIPSTEVDKVPETAACEEEDDTLETQSVTHETSSTIDTSECGDTPKKAKKKRRNYGNKRRRGRGNKAKPSFKSLDTSSADEKIDEVVSTKLVPKVMLSPLLSTQVPVVSEGPGQSALESEDFLQPKDVGKVESMSNVIERCTENLSDRKDEPVPDKPQRANPARNTRSKQPVLDSGIKDIVPPRVTRSRQPTITIAPDVLENFGIRKKRKSTLDKKNNTSENMEECKAVSIEQPKKSIQRKRGKGVFASSQDDLASPVAAAGSMESIDSNDLNTQVHEVSEGPGEVVDSYDENKQPLQVETPKDNDSSANKKLKPENSGQGIPDSPMSPSTDARGNSSTKKNKPTNSTQDSPMSPTSDAAENSPDNKLTPVNSSQGIPDSPMSPPSDPLENEVVQPRITRSKNRKLREGMGYITVKPPTSIDEIQLNAESCEGAERSAETLQTPVDNQSCTMKIAASERTQGVSDHSKGKNEALSSSTVENNIPTLKNKESLDLSERVVVQSKLGVEVRNNSTTGSEPDPITKDSADGNKIPNMEQESLDLGEFVNTVTQSDSGSELVTNNSATELITNNSTIESGLLVTNVNSTTEVKNPMAVMVTRCSDTIATSGFRVQSPTARPTSLLHAGGIVSELQVPMEVISPESTERNSSPLDSKPPQERQEVLETLNSILKLSSQNKKIADSLTADGHIKPLEKKEAIVHLKSVSDDEFDSGDAADGLVVDEDRDFSDDDDNSAELASRIDQIIKDQIKVDKEQTCDAKKTESSKTKTGKENSKDSLGKRKDSIDERTGLPTTFLQKLRDPRIRSKLLSHLEETEDLPPAEPTDSTKAPVSETPASYNRDPRAIRSVTDSRRWVEALATTPELTVGAKGLPSDKTGIGNVSNLIPTTAVPKVGANILRDAVDSAASLKNMVDSAAVLSGAGNPPALVRGVANTPPAMKSTIAPVVIGTPRTTPIVTRGPLLPTPAALLPTVTALRHTIPAINRTSNHSRTGVTLSYVRPGVTPTSEFVEPNKADDVDDDEEENEALKRRPKKQKKELDTELMYKSPLEDLQSESRPTYDRNPSRGTRRYDRRNFLANNRGRRDSSETMPSRWDVRHNGGRRERDNLRYPESQYSYNQDRWGTQTVNGSINPIPSDGQINQTPWKHNWYPEHIAHPNDMVHQEPRLNFMDTQLMNLSLLPKTTNLNIPPFTKIYSSFNHGNPQILGIAPPTYDPKEKASTITMMDPMGQEMIDIVQLPRPTSGLTSAYFNDLPDEFSLEELITHPYLALSDMMDEEMEIENHGINIFNDSDEERKIVRGNLASRRHAKDPRNQSSVLLEKIDNVNNEESGKSFAENDPLENILHCLPALKEQYAFKKSKQYSISDPWDDDSDKLVAPPPPTWSNDIEPGPKEVVGKDTSPQDNESALKNWRNPSPPKKKTPSKKKKSPTRRKSRSKSPLRRKHHRSVSNSPTRCRSKSRSWSPEPWKRTRSRSPYKGRSRSPYSKGRSRSPYSKRSSRSRSPYSKGRSRSPAYRTRVRSRSRSRDKSRSKVRSRSNSSERLGHPRMTKRSRSRSPSYHRSSNSPSRKRLSKR